MGRFSLRRLLWLVLIFALNAQSAKIKHIEVESNPLGIKIHTDSASGAGAFAIDDPDRVVIDVPGSCGAKPKHLPAPFKGFRQGQHPGRCRLVFEPDYALEPLLLKSKPGVINVSFKNYEREAILKLFDEPTVPLLRQFVVVIDAGHGGKDPGAIGGAGTKEKDVVLALARALKTELDKDKRIKAVLTRSSDTYLPLRARMDIARRAKADVFLSIHADAFKNRRANGASVYVLSEKGASSEAAKWLATRENDVDLVGGLSLDDKPPMLASILLDLSQNATAEDSDALANDILDSLGNITPLHKPLVERAGFVVLKSPDVPSILIEAGFISNKYGERRLASKRYQHQFAKAVKAAIDKYMAKRAGRSAANQGYNDYKTFNTANCQPNCRG